MVGELPVAGTVVVGLSVAGTVVNALMLAASAGWSDPTSSERLATTALRATTMAAAANAHRH